MAKKTHHPAEPLPGPTPSEALRAEIARRGLTAYGVGKIAGVDISILQRFLSGERMLSLNTFDKVCAALGMVLRNAGEK